MKLTRQLTAAVMAVTLGLALAPAAQAAAEKDDNLSDLRTQLGDQWVLQKNDRRANIKTWIKQEDNKKYRSFKVEATLNGDMQTFARVLLDADSYSKWYWEVTDSKLLHQASPTEYYIYLKHRAPVGQPDRDVILHASVEPQTNDNSSMMVQVRSAPSFIAEKPNLVRMPAEDMSIKLTPLPGNRIQLEAEGYVDPGGTVPNWAINFIQRSAPYSIILGLQRMMNKSEYAKSKEALPFPILSSR